jgi:hypothetical protein
MHCLAAQCGGIDSPVEGLVDELGISSPSKSHVAELAAGFREGGRSGGWSCL